MNKVLKGVTGTPELRRPTRHEFDAASEKDIEQAKSESENLDPRESAEHLDYANSTHGGDLENRKEIAAIERRAAERKAAEARAINELKEAIHNTATDTGAKYEWANRDEVLNDPNLISLAKQAGYETFNPQVLENAEAELIKAKEMLSEVSEDLDTYRATHSGFFGGLRSIFDSRGGMLKKEAKNLERRVSILQALSNRAKTHFDRAQKVGVIDQPEVPVKANEPKEAEPVLGDWGGAEDFEIDDEDRAADKNAKDKKDVATAAGDGGGSDKPPVTTGGEDGGNNEGSEESAEGESSRIVIVNSVEDVVKDLPESSRSSWSRLKKTAAVLLLGLLPDATSNQNTSLDSESVSMNIVKAVDLPEVKPSIGENGPELRLGESDNGYEEKALPGYSFHVVDGLNFDYDSAEIENSNKFSATLTETIGPAIDQVMKGYADVGFPVDQISPSTVIDNISVDLVITASPEGSTEYNFNLNEKRIESAKKAFKEALADKGLDGVNYDINIVNAGEKSEYNEHILSGLKLLGFVNEVPADQASQQKLIDQFANQMRNGLSLSKNWAAQTLYELYFENERKASFDLSITTKNLTVEIAPDLDDSLPASIASPGVYMTLESLGIKNDHGSVISETLSEPMSESDKAAK